MTAAGNNQWIRIELFFFFHGPEHGCFFNYVCIFRLGCTLFWWNRCPASICTGFWWIIGIILLWNVQNYLQIILIAIWCKLFYILYVFCQIGAGATPLADGDESWRDSSSWKWLQGRWTVRCARDAGRWFWIFGMGYWGFVDFSREFLGESYRSSEQFFFHIKKAANILIFMFIAVLGHLDNTFHRKYILLVPKHQKII